MPDKPGCYIMRNAAGRIIYVGKAKILASLYRLSPGLVARILRSG